MSLRARWLLTLVGILSFLIFIGRLAQLGWQWKRNIESRLDSIVERQQQDEVRQDARGALRYVQGDAPRVQVPGPRRHLRSAPAPDVDGE
ncbi:MAG TPA: hypothetical protein VM677_31870 [Actinokineospora sp.]|jgi:hypothetical protein|nr:hypothetical protein [Actinokineospora sp.]